MAYVEATTWWKRAAYIFMIAMATVALAVVVSLVFQTFFNNPPITVYSLDEPLTTPLCPGQVLDVHNQITVDGPTLLFSYFSVMDEGQNYNINGTQVSNGVRTHPHPSTFTQTLHWMVPDLPPGNYSRVLAFRGTDGREKSLFTIALFTIGVNCP